MSGLSDLAGLSPAAVGHIERGRNASATLDTTERLARALRVPPEWLAFGVGTGPAFTRTGRRAK
jgi:transcriptional regulator with XRE-family HTH domain